MIKDAKKEAHDASGFETEMINWEDLNDGYGNKVAHGDLTVQRLVERGVRDYTWPKDCTSIDPVGYDKDPWMKKC